MTNIFNFTTGMHATLANFNEKPSFFALELMIVKRLLQQQRGEQPGYQAMSQQAAA